ncbi:MAG: hypothetical protein ABIQ40_05750 [Bacteroidia bacterium]
MRLPQRISFSFHSALRLLVKDYFLGLAVFTILRILFIFFNHAAAELVPEKWLALSVLRGIQFDSVSCGIIPPDSARFYVDRAIDPYLFMRNGAESNRAGSADADKIKQQKEFIAASLQLLGKRFFVPL